MPGRKPETLGSREMLELNNTLAVLVAAANQGCRLQPSVQSYLFELVNANISN